MDIKSQPRDTLARLLSETYGGDIEALKSDVAALGSPPVKQPSRHHHGVNLVVSVQNVSRRYKLGKTTVDAVKDVSLEVYEGEVVALTGASGSGKSTVLNLIGGLDKPTSGLVEVAGSDLGKLSDKKLSQYRAQKIGFVFQFFYLQPFLNLQTNVEMPGMFTRTPRGPRGERALEVLEAVGLKDRAGSLPQELSGGQMQRVAIARALLNKPALVIADEPTGNLDTTNAQLIMDQFLAMREQSGAAVLIVTHDPAIAARADRIITMRDGQVVT